MTLNSIDLVFSIFQMTHRLQEVIDVIVISVNKPILDLIVELRRDQLVIHVALRK